MSKQRFLGGLLGANPLRAGSFTDVVTGTDPDYSSPLTPSTQSVSGLNTQMYGPKWNSDGTRLEYFDDYNDAYQYFTASTPYDITTLTQAAELTTQPNTDSGGGANWWTNAARTQFYYVRPNIRQPSRIQRFNFNTTSGLTSEITGTPLLSTSNEVTDSHAFGTGNVVDNNTKLVLPNLQHDRIHVYPIVDTFTTTTSLGVPALFSVANIEACAMHPDGEFIAVLLNDGTLKMYEMSTAFNITTCSEVYAGSSGAYGDGMDVTSGTYWTPPGIFWGNDLLFIYDNDTQTMYEVDFGKLSTSTDRTTSNVGILSLDEAGVEDIEVPIEVPSPLDLTTFTSSVLRDETVSDYRTLTAPAGSNGYGYSYIDISGHSGKLYFEWEKAPTSYGGFGLFSGTNGAPYSGSNEAFYSNSFTPEIDVFGLQIQSSGTLQRRRGTAASSAVGTSGAYGDVLLFEIDADTGDFWAGATDATNTSRVYITSTDTVVTSRPATPTGNSANLNYLYVGHFNDSAVYYLNSQPSDYVVAPETGYGALITGSTEARELTQLNWGGIRGRDVLTGGTAASGDANWSDVALLVDNTSVTTDRSNNQHSGISVATGTVTTGSTDGSSVPHPYGSTSVPYLDFSSARVELPSSVDLSGGDWTIETWAWFDTIAEYNSLFSSPVGGWQLDFDASGQLRFIATSTLTKTGALSTNTWYFVSLSYVASTQTLYLGVDGNVVSSSNSEWASMTANYMGGSGNDIIRIAQNRSDQYNEPHDGKMSDIRFTAGVARYTSAFTPPTEALPQGAPVAASDPSLANTGILSLSELLQASYGLGPTGPASVDIVLSLWGGGGGGGGTRNASAGTTEESGAGGNGAYLEVLLSGPLATDAVLKRYVGGGGNGGPGQSGLQNALGGAGGAATIVVLENAAGTSFLPIAVAAAGGGGGGAGSQAAADAGPGAGGAAVDSSTGLTTSPRNSPAVANTAGGDAAGGGTSSAGGAAPSPNGRSNSSPGSSRTTANGLTIAQDGGQGAINVNSNVGTTNAGGSNGSPYGGDGGRTASSAAGSSGNGDGGGGGGGWYGGSGGGCASGGNEGGSGGGAGSSYVNVGTHTFEGQDITITVRSSAVGDQNANTGTNWTAVANPNTGYWASATALTGRGGQGTSSAESSGADGYDGAVHVGPLNGSLVSSVTTAGAAEDITIATIAPDAGAGAGAGSGPVGTIAFTTTASTSSHSETHTADATWSTSGDIIIHDGWNQQNSDIYLTHNKRNHGTFTVAGGNVTVDVEVWGAAGGSGQGSYTGYGGGGEYRKARMVLKPGTYYWMVGGGGGVGSNVNNRQGSGGWGGGGSSGSYNGAGNDATAFGNGGDISGVSNSRNALGAGGGGLTGIFGATSASQADALLVAGGGGGYGYQLGTGENGGSSGAISASSSAGGTGGSDNGAAGKGGHGSTRGGGGGGGYWGGAGGNDGGVNYSGGGGGRGYTVASDGHALVGTVSGNTTEAGSGGAAGGTGSANYITHVGTSTGSSSVAGRGGRLAITIV